MLEEPRQGSPQDNDLSAVSARLARMAGDWRTSLALADDILSRMPGDLHAKMLRVTALLHLERHREAAEDLVALRKTAPAGPVIEALNAEVARPTADFLARVRSGGAGPRERLTAGREVRLRGPRWRLS